MEEFSVRIYSSEKFFDAVFKLHTYILPDLIVNPEIFLAQAGKIIYIGIWNVSQNGYIKLGFEFEEQGDKKIVFIKGREWAVWQLSLYLQGGEN
jgi:hypothetical protein